MTTTDIRNQEFGTRFREARKQAKLTQQKLADLVGISQAAIHKLEAGHFQSSRNTVMIAMACQVNPVWLETGQGDKHPTETREFTIQPISKKKEELDLHIQAIDKRLEQTVRELTEIRQLIRLYKNHPTDQHKINTE